MLDKLVKMWCYGTTLQNAIDLGEKIVLWKTLDKKNRIFLVGSLLTVFNFISQFFKPK